MADLTDLISRLEQIEQELSELAISRLRDSLEGDESASGDERRITRARRSVEKAAGLLAGMPLDTSD